MARDARLLHQELRQRQVPVPKEGRSFIHPGKQVVPVKLIVGRRVVGRVQRPLCPDEPGRGIIHSDLRDAHGVRMDHGNLEHLYAVAGQDITAVAVRLLLVVLARFHEYRGRRNPVRGQGHITREEGEPGHRREVCGGQEHLLAGCAGAGDDAPLGGADKGEDGIPLFRLREVGLDVRDGVADIHALEVQGVVDVLDLVDLFLGETAAGQAHAVHTLEAHRFATGQHVRRDVLHDLETGAHHRVRADVGELVRQGAAADDGPVRDLRLAGQGDMAHDDAVAADLAVMGDMGVGHDERVAAHLGQELAAGLGAAVDGGTFADGHPVADLHPGHLAFVLEVLWDRAYDRARKDGAITAHFDIGKDDGVREELAAVADLDVVVDKDVGTDFDVVAEPGIRADGSERVDLIHGQSLFQDGAKSLRGLGIEVVAGLERRDAGVQPAAGEAEIAQEVQQLVPAALVGKMKLQVVQVALVGDRQVGHVEEGGDGSELFRAHGMLHDDDGIVHVPAFDEVVLEEVFNLVEEAEGAADADFTGIVHGFVPMGGLDAEDAGTEVHGDVRGRGVGRHDPDPGARLFIPDFQRLGDVDIDAGLALVHETVGQERFHIGSRTAVQDGNLAVVQFDEGVVHAEAGKGRHDMLDGDRLGPVLGTGGAAGCVRVILGEGFDHRTAGEVRAADLDAVPCGGRRNGHVGISPCVKAFSLEPVGLVERMLVAVHTAKIGKNCGPPKSTPARSGGTWRTLSYRRAGRCTGNPAASVPPSGCCR